MGDTKIEWVKEPFDLEIAIDLSDGRVDGRLVEAWMVKGTGKQLAVHRELNNGPYKDTWNVSHVGSGNGLTFCSGSKRTAARRAQRIWEALPAVNRKMMKRLKFGQRPKQCGPENVRKLILAYGGILSELPEAK